VPDVPPAIVPPPPPPANGRHSSFRDFPYRNELALALARGLAFTLDRRKLRARTINSMHIFQDDRSCGRSNRLKSCSVTVVGRGFHLKPPSDGDVTALLQAWSQGDQHALDKLTPIVYAELHCRISSSFSVTSFPMVPNGQPRGIR
jgi:hypothetical protein